MPHPSSTVSGPEASASSDQTNAELVVISLETIRTLEQDLDSRDAAGNIIAQYVALWPHRLNRLATSIQQGDRPASLDAILSLKVSSQTVGAQRLANLALCLENHLRDHDDESAIMTLQTIATCGSQTMPALLTHTNGASQS